MNPSVSIIIAAKDSLHFLREFLPLLCRQLSEMGAGSEILVFDDGSSDGTHEFLAAQMPDVRVYRGEQNVGYVRARNRAFEMATNDCVVSLDSDIEIRDGFLTAALEPMDDPRVFATACRCLNVTQDMRNETLTRGGFERGLFRIRQSALLGEVPDAAPGPVLYAPGGISVFRRSIFLEFGGFDETFYPGYGGEDVDFSWRAQKRGYRLAYAPEAIAVHHHRGTMKHLLDERAISNIYQRNLLLFTWKNLSDRRILIRHGVGVLRMFRSLRQINILFSALRRMPAVLSGRRRERHHWRRADREILPGVHAAASKAHASAR